MPTLNIFKKSKRENHRNENTPMREIRKKAYSSTEWRKIRNTYIKQHPLCEECLSKGRITPAQDVHHIKSPFKTGEINWNLLLDYDNLQALCKQCHAEHHNKEQGYKPISDIINDLDRLLNEDSGDISKTL